eukprot:TRINITY_DN17961_c0_g1_i1.p1 TRINITY_DN17961_c0_g1~~TRINITY_DN17961_c0_g1_i1.p1  ORF type:complete len:462 (-),score=30.17 TRINITY_DN17961_c0_g1_i1:51-1436(-)
MTQTGCEMPVRMTALMKRLGKQDTPEPRCWWGFGPEEDPANPVERCHKRECEELVVHRSGVAQQVRTGLYTRGIDKDGNPAKYEGRAFFVGGSFQVYYSSSACFEDPEEVKPAERFIFNRDERSKEVTCRGWHIGQAVNGRTKEEWSGISCYDDVEEPVDTDPVTCRTKKGPGIFGNAWRKDYSVRFLCIKRDQSDREVGFVDQALLHWSQPDGTMTGVKLLVTRAANIAWSSLKNWVRTGMQSTKTCFSFEPVKHRGLACWSFVKKVGTIAFAVASVACLGGACAIVAGVSGLTVASVVWASVRVGADTYIQRKGKTAGDHAWSWFAVILKVVGTGLQFVGAAVGAPYTGAAAESLGHALVTTGQTMTIIGIDPKDLIGREYNPDSKEDRLSRLMTECELVSEATNERFMNCMIDPENDFLKKLAENGDLQAVNRDDEGNLQVSCDDIRLAANLHFGRSS